MNIYIKFFILLMICKKKKLRDNLNNNQFKNKRTSKSDSEMDKKS